MEDRILTQQEEILNDQIASIFYVTRQPQPVLPQIEAVITNQPTDSRTLVIDAVLGRVYNEQAIRRNYLMSQLGIKDSESAEATLLATATAPTEELAQQLSYYRAVASNLTRYELETWQRDHQEMLRALLRQSKPQIESLSSLLNAFTEQFYSGGYFQRLDLVSIPPALQTELGKVGLTTELNNRPTIIQKAAFISYLNQICAIITALPEGTPEPTALTAISAATLSFKPTIEPPSIS